MSFKGALRAGAVRSAARAGAGLLGAAALAVTGATAAHAQPRAAVPDHVFAPYFQTYLGDDPVAMSQASGAKYLTFAFLQTESPGSCTVYWDGTTSRPVSGDVYGQEIAALRAAGGGAIPSFGGYSADHNGTEIADSCTDIGKIAAAYEKVITTYDVTRLDMDIEVEALNDSAGIDRRNKAIAQVQDWAAANGRTLEISYTLPTTTHGLASSGLAVLRNAKSNGARVDLVNIMTFDYYDGAQHDMGSDTKSAASGLHGQLANLYPSKSSQQLWNMVSVTAMPGVDDYGPEETFTKADAPAVVDWANATGIGGLSFWALQRDNGSCPGGGASNTCSGISQPTWYFSNEFERFTGAGGGDNGGGGDHGGDCTAAPAWSGSQAYQGGDEVSYGGHLWQAKWWNYGATPGGSVEVWVDEGTC